jgi:signal transduction histidine kinase
LGALALLETHDDAAFTDEVQRLLFIAKTNGDRLHGLINDILDLQKFSARQMRFSLTSQPICQLVDEAMMAHMALADQHKVSIRPVPSDRSLIGVVDSKRFHQVMANLLSNAVKFASPHSQIEVFYERQANMIRVSVCNSGPGIPDSFRDRIFRPFSQASSMSKLRTGGTGLGLSISKQIVEQMGGNIGFDSVTDDKTTFWFTVRGEDAAE